MTVCDGCNQLMNGLADYCPDCERDMQEIEDRNTDCRKCGGSGEVEWDDDACSIVNMEMCWVCKGTGERPS